MVSEQEWARLSAGAREDILALLRPATPYDSSPLHLAAWRGDPLATRGILEGGADPNHRLDGLTPLHVAAQGQQRYYYGSPPSRGGPPRDYDPGGVMVALLEAGAAAADRDEGGYIPYDYATNDAEKWLLLRHSGTAYQPPRAARAVVGFATGKGSPTSWPWFVSKAEQKEALYRAQGGVCPGCLVAFPMRNLVVDHVHPKSRGGPDNFGNLQLLCGACNSTKGRGSHRALVRKLREQGIR